MLLLYVNLAGKMEVVSILSLLDKICHFDSIHRAEKKPETFSLASVNARFDPVYLKQEAMAEIEEYARRSLKEMRKDSLIMIKEEDFSSDLLRKLLGEKKQQLKSELEGACRERGLTAGAIEKLWQGYEAKPDYEKLLADVDRIKSMVHSGVAGIRSAYGRMLVFSEEEEVELLNDFFLDQGAPGREEWVNKKIEEVVRGKISALLKKLSVLGVEISYEWDNAKDVEENRSLLAGELASVSETITEETGEYLDLAESNLADLNIKDAEEMILWAEENILKLRGTAVLLAQGITAIEERQDRLEDLCGRTREVLKEFARTEKNPVLIQRERRYEALLSAVKVANYPEALAGKITEAQRKVVEEIAIMRAFISEEYSRLLEEYGLSADEIDSWQVDVFLGDLNEEGLKRYLKSFALSKCRRRLRYLEGKVRVLEKSELSEETIMAVGREIAEVRSMIPAQIRPDLSAEYSSLEEEFSNLRLLFGRFKILQRRFPEFGAKRLTNILRRHKDKNADFVTALILSDSSLRKSGVVKVDPLNRAVYTDNLLLLDLAQMDAGNVRSVFITIKIEHIKIRDFSDLVVINADKKTEGEKSAILKMMLYNLLRLRDQRELSISIDGRPWNVWAGLCYYRSADRELVEDCQAYIKANVRNEYLSEVVLLGLGNAVYCVSAGYVDVWIIEDMDKVIHVRLIRDEDSFTLESVNPGKDFADFFSFVEKDTVALPVARAVTRGENLSDIDMCV